LEHPGDCIFDGHHLPEGDDRLLDESPGLLEDTQDLLGQEISQEMLDNPTTLYKTWRQDEDRIVIIQLKKGKKGRLQNPSRVYKRLRASPPLTEPEIYLKKLLRIRCERKNNLI